MGSHASVYQSYSSRLRPSNLLSAHLPVGDSLKGNRFCQVKTLRTHARVLQGIFKSKTSNSQGESLPPKIQVTHRNRIL